MKKNRINSLINCLLVSIIFYTSCKSPSPSGLTESDKQYIKDQYTSAQEGWNRGDRAPYVNRYSTDVIFMAPNMETIAGKDAIRTFTNSFPDVKVTFKVVEIMGSADYAYVLGAFTITNPTDTFLDKGKFLSVWNKFPDEKWILTHDIFNSDLPVSVAQENTDKKVQN